MNPYARVENQLQCLYESLSPERDALVLHSWCCLTVLPNAYMGNGENWERSFICNSGTELVPVGELLCDPARSIVQHH